MAIPNKQIGWSQESNLLWEISRQLDKILKIVCTSPCQTTNTTTTESCTGSHPISFYIPDTITGNPDFSASASNACDALNCILDFTCSVIGASEYFVNSIPLSINDSIFASNTGCTINIPDGFYPIDDGVYRVAEIVNGIIVSFINCSTTTTTTTTVTNLCNSYTITNLDDFDTVYSYLDCDGVLVDEVPILAFASATFCARTDSINFNSQIVDNGICI